MSPAATWPFGSACCVVGHRQALQADGEPLQRPQRQAVHRLERQEHLDHRVAVRLRRPGV